MEMLIAMDFIKQINTNFARANIDKSMIGMTAYSKSKVVITVPNSTNCHTEKCSKTFTKPFTSDKVTAANDFIMAYLSQKEQKASFN